MRVRRTVAVPLLLAAAAAASHGQDLPPPGPAPETDRPADDAVRSLLLRSLVWDAVDAAEDALPRALAELTGLPGVTWSEVAGHLRAGRDYRKVPRPAPAVTDPAAHAAYFADFPWETGRVRTYRLGDDAPYWYSVDLPEGYDGSGSVPVWFDLGLFADGAPPGFAHVRLNDHVVGAASLGSAQMSMTAGFAIQSIVLSVLADLERRFDADRDRVFCGGFSRTGNATLYEGVHWPDLWAGIAPASGYYDFDDALLPNLEHVAVLAASGRDAGHKASNECTAGLARRLVGVRHRDVTVHASGGRAVDGLGPVFLEWIADRRRTPLPRSFTYVLSDPRHRGAYWLEIVEVKSPGPPRTVVIGVPGDTTAERFEVHTRPASAHVEVTSPNEVRVRAVNVAEFRLLLSPDLFDLTKPVRVTLGSRTVEVVPRPSIGMLVRNFRRDGDRRRLFPAEVSLRP